MVAKLDADRSQSLADAVLISAVKWLQTYDDRLTEAEAKKLLARRATRMTTQRKQRGYDPNLHSRVVISMTGNP